MQDAQGFTRVSHKRANRARTFAMRRGQQHAATDRIRKRVTIQPTPPGDNANPLNIAPRSAVSWADRVAATAASTPESPDRPENSHIQTFFAATGQEIPYPFSIPAHLQLTGRFSVF